MAIPSHDKLRRLKLFETEEQLKLRTWVQLARTFYLIQRRIVTLLATRDLTLPQFDVLATLRYSDGCNQQELAKRLLVTKGNVCGILDRLEAVGWVQRRSGSTDKRSNRLRLTSRGRRKIDSVLPEHDVLVLEALRACPAADVETLRGLLQKLAESNTQPA